MATHERPGLNLIKCEPWYAGAISEKTAEGLLVAKEPGSFLVRDSFLPEADYVLSVRFNDDVWHYDVCIRSDSECALYKYCFVDLPTAVRFFSENRLGPVYLRLRDEPVVSGVQTLNLPPMVKLVRAPHPKYTVLVPLTSLPGSGFHSQYFAKLKPPEFQRHVTVLPPDPVVELFQQPPGDLEGKQSHEDTQDIAFELSPVVEIPELNEGISETKRTLVPPGSPERSQSITEGSSMVLKTLEPLGSPESSQRVTERSPEVVSHSSSNQETSTTAHAVPAEGLALDMIQPRPDEEYGTSQDHTSPQSSTSLPDTFEDSCEVVPSHSQGCYDDEVGSATGHAHDNAENNVQQLAKDFQSTLASQLQQGPAPLKRRSRVPKEHALLCPEGIEIFQGPIAVMPNVVGSEPPAVQRRSVPLITRPRTITPNDLCLAPGPINTKRTGKKLTRHKSLFVRGDKF